MNHAASSHRKNLSQHHTVRDSTAQEPSSRHSKSLEFLEIPEIDAFQCSTMARIATVGPPSRKPIKLTWCGISQNALIRASDLAGVPNRHDRPGEVRRNGWNSGCFDRLHSRVRCHQFPNLLGILVAHGFFAQFQFQRGIPYSLPCERSGHTKLAVDSWSTTAWKTSDRWNQPEIQRFC